MRRPYGDNSVGLAAMVVGTDGRDRLRGSGSDDIFDVSQGGHDRVLGRNGNDEFYFGAQFGPRDAVLGGAGDDTLILRGSYSHPLAMNSDKLDSVESLLLVGDKTFRFALADELTIDGPLSVSAGSSASTTKLEIDGSGLTATALSLAGSAGDDVLLGGRQSDTIYSGSGSDVLAGGPGDDRLRAGNYADALPQNVTVMFGGDGDDTITSDGSVGTAVLAGGAGRDALTGFEDCADTFYFDSAGRDTISEFHVGQDRIWINSVEAMSYDDLTIVQSVDGLSTTVSWGDKSGFTLTYDFFTPVRFLSEKDFHFGSFSVVKNAQDRLDTVSAFGDAPASAGPEHHISAHAVPHPVPHDAGLAALA